MIRAAALTAILSAVVSLARAPAAPALAPRAIAIPAAIRTIVSSARRIDPPAREVNWTGRRGQGSCMHASLWHLFHFQGRPDLAAFWRRHHGDGETFGTLAAKLDVAKIDYALCERPDEKFLEWAARTRRGAVVSIAPAHAVAFCGLDRQNAFILDPNAPGHIQRLPRAEFFDAWKSQGGYALTPLAGPPLPPAPWFISFPEIKQ